MVCPPWAAVLGSGTRVDADNRRTTNPLTGEPDAGNPPVRFGGKGKVQSLVPTPIERFAEFFGVGKQPLKEVFIEIIIRATELLRALDRKLIGTKED